MNQMIFFTLILSPRSSRSKAQWAVVEGFERINYNFNIFYRCSNPSTTLPLAFALDRFDRDERRVRFCINVETFLSLLFYRGRVTLRSFFFLICASCQYLCASERPSFQGHSQEIPADIKQMMIGCSWMPECPVSLDDLRYLIVTHWGYDDEVHTGHLIVHAKLADEFLEIFSELFDAHFPIERMELIDFYNADDEASMAVNNSSAFCCRAITNMPGTFSLHSYGSAIDINPLINPYVKGSQVLPEGGRAYLDRTQPYPGIITRSEDNACYRIFVSHGYEWGGDLQGRVDYQHFQKQSSAVR